MNFILAEAAKASESIGGLSVATILLLLSTVGAGLMWLLNWIEKRAAKREAHELELAKLAAEAERDAVIEGVERVDDKLTKASIKKTALERGVSSLSSAVAKTTRRLGPPAALLLTCGLLAGCYGRARDDAAFYAEINAGHASDASISTDARAIAQDNADAWAVQAWELGGDEPPADVLRRVRGEPVIAAPNSPGTPGVGK